MLLSRINIISACSICTLVNSNNAVRVATLTARCAQVLQRRAVEDQPLLSEEL